MTEPDAVHRVALVLHLQRQVLLAHQPLAHDLHLFAKHRRRKTLAPHLGVQRVHQVGAAVLFVQRAVGLHAPLQGGGVQPFVGHLLQRGLKGVQVLFVDGAARRHGVAAEAQQHAGVALGHQVQRVAQVKAGDGAARALELVFLALRAAGGEHEGGAVHLVLQARSDDADHAFVEVRVEHDQRRGRLFGCVEHLFGQRQRLVAHLAFDGLALAVDAVERPRQFVGTQSVVGGQAFDAERHVGQAPGSVQARAEREAEVEAGGFLWLTRCDIEQRGHARRHGAGAHTLEALRDQAAVVGVELDHIGHGAECDQREQRVDLRLCLCREHAALPQLRAQGE